MCVLLLSETLTPWGFRVEDPEQDLAIAFSQYEMLMEDRALQNIYAGNDASATNPSFAKQNIQKEERPMKVIRTQTKFFLFKYGHGFCKLISPWPESVPSWPGSHN